MALIELNLKPERRTLAQFGWIALAAFGLVAAAVLWKKAILGIPLGAASRPVAGVLAGIGVVSALLSLLAPQGNRFLYVGLILITFPIGFVLSYVFMGLIFYGILTPVGFVFRLLRRDPLWRRFDAKAPTYWVEHREPESVEQYFRQY